ncbi:membrane transporter, partial [Mycena amicta]
MSASVVSTVVDYVAHGGLKRPSWGALNSSPAAASSVAVNARLGASQDGNGIELLVQAPAEEVVPVREVEAEAEDPELRLPSRGSLAVMIATNALLQFAFFVTVSSAASYAEYLGGSAVFSGLTIGIPTVFSGLALIPLTRYDQGRYTRPLIVGFIALVIGNIFHAVAYPAHFLYFILIGRIVSGVAFTGFMYSKRYCSDSRIIGIRRRTTLASWLVLGQAFGFSVGPFIGGLLFKIGFDNTVFNGFTSTGWVTSTFTLVFAGWSLWVFQDVPKRVRVPSSTSVEASASTEHPDEYGFSQLTLKQWGVIASMCWASMTCFFILGSWEANIPVFTASAPAFHYSPYAAGNFIALGGIATLPFLLANVRYAPRVQDRTTLALGTGIGFTGLLLTMALLSLDKMVFASFYICWVLVALGFNLASTCTFSLLSKQFPNAWNGRTSMMIQYSNYAGRVTGAVLGGAGVQMGMKRYVGVQMGVVGVGAVLHCVFWKQLKAKTGV